MRVLLAAAALAATIMHAEVPAGIPRELARQRAAAVSGVRYRLAFTLRPKAAAVPGAATITFTLQQPVPLLLDYREGTLDKVSVNGTALKPEIVNGHVVLPAANLRAGENTVTAAFDSPVATAGKAFIRFEDRDDNTEYLYTLFVPMDASMAFPCFDQPDIKAKFTLVLDLPPTWTAISNAHQLGRGRFAETEAISTYLFAFAAGPFRKLGPSLGMSTLWVRPSKLRRAEEEANDVLNITDKGVEFLSRYFNRPFPFAKYDMVLLPGFAFGGMEHAGATFLREEAVLFRTEPTLSDRMGRARLLLHELTHQWFGDLVTMRWFDDLWLKEGFANYMAYRALEDLAPSSGTWKRFYETIRPAAYGIDITPGTTPVYQDIPNLADAKSAYGAIVYSKAPALLRQLSFIIGETAFRDGLRLYLAEHAYGNAEWSDLVGAFERASGRKLGRFADAWIRHRAMPRVTVDWACASGRISRFEIAQTDVLGEGGVWPVETGVRLVSASGTESVRASFDSARAAVPAAIGKPCPDWVYANDGDHAYGLFLLDDRSREAVEARLGAIDDPFLRSQLWGALWDSLRDAHMPPERYLALAARLLPEEKDEALLQTTLPRVATVLHRYVNARGEWPAKFATVAAGRMRDAATPDLRITWFRGFRAFAETPAALDQVRAILDGTLKLPGIAIKPLDRWNMITTLVAHGYPASDKLLAAEREHDRTDEARKYAWIAEAARPDAQAKQRYFDDYLKNRALAEDWVEGSLGAFNYWSQSTLTLPYLAPALEALPQMKRERRIFFVLAWLNAFIGGQSSEPAARAVRSFLQQKQIDPDLRRKILEVDDELERAVRIRTAF